MNIRLVLVILIVWLALAVSAGAVTKEEKPLGEVGFAIGGVYPQGDFVVFSDPGPNFGIRLNLRPRALKAAALRIEFGGNFFKEDKTPIDVWAGTVYLAGEKSVSQTAWTLHAGFQLGSGSNRGFMRPRVSLSPGLYIFNIRTGYRVNGADEDLYTENDTQAKFGFRGAVGSTFFFSTKWGLSFDFIYDHVYSLHQLEGRDEFGNYTVTSNAANFHTYSLGVVIPLDRL